MKKMASKQTVLQQKTQKCAKKIWGLGSLPSDALDKYINVLQKQLFKQLEKANLEQKEEKLLSGKSLQAEDVLKEAAEKAERKLLWGRHGIPDPLGLEAPRTQASAGRRSPAHPPTPRPWQLSAGRMGRHLSTRPRIKKPEINHPARQPGRARPSVLHRGTHPGQSVANIRIFEYICEYSLQTIFMNNLQTGR